MGGAPYVKVVDVTSGSGPTISGSSYVSSNLITATPQKSIAGAAATVLQQVTLFPGTVEPSGGKGLVSLRLQSASVDCTSATTSGVLGAASGKYSFELGWWGRGPGDAQAVWHTDVWSYDSSVNTVPVLVSGPAWDPARTQLSNSTTLAQYLTAPGFGAVPSVLSTGATSGLRGFSDGVFTLTTASTLTNELVPGYSAIKVQVGQLTCMADDQR